ncbi:sigma-54-dependent Fis family transcriptional regulator [Sphingosinicella sp. CPCC 101087]|uniref:sigma-54 interaction domain-containing protein n=1 Tax=Sphingosinicella sp. CPCC 101087 TaxID=2497754 RepID=UPI00101BD36E|nr:sigma 54-interacting transcriptional regulator [Sphingosinicella sp. CPCC 101087]
MIGLSRKAAAANAALAGWLGGAGLKCRIFDAGDTRPPGPAIFSAAEASHAGPGDVVVDYGAVVPSLVVPADDEPARIGFGFEDMAFGHAMIAELVRPAGRPACGEPESARLIDYVGRIAASDASVLVLGDTGTGKEGIARHIHSCSPRARGAFTAVNCAALPETMLEAILFGHRRGSFTGATQEGEGLFRAASGGTLLLDEISEIPLALQAKLLRALQEKEVLPVGAVKPEPVDVRIVACANRDLAAEVAAGRFRADLYWRLNVVPVQLQPLTERRLDIRAIAAALILRHVPAGEPVPFPTAAALDRLMDHAWPGNCRELDNVIQRALLLRAGDRIEAEEIVIDRVPGPAPERVRSLGEVSKLAQASVIRDALAAADGHRTRAAERLGISERTLRYRLAEMRAAAA